MSGDIGPGDVVVCVDAPTCWLCGEATDVRVGVRYEVSRTGWGMQNCTGATRPCVGLVSMGQVYPVDWFRKANGGDLANLTKLLDQPVDAPRETVDA